MSSFSSVSERMEYIQMLFMKAGAFTQNGTAWAAVIRLLDEEPPEYRSVAYEGASFEIAMKDMNKYQELRHWKEFKQASLEHSFHVDIGLGWAFAKSSLSPQSYIESIGSLPALMVLDGIGYYYGLFRGRTTLKSKLVPEEFEGESLRGFDQGVGRRLWYTAKGDVDKALELLQSFPASRHSDLIRGIGIACGYVGGSEADKLKHLNKISGDHQKQLQIGVALAAISRIVSGTVTSDIDLASFIICNKTVNELETSMISTASKFLYLYANVDSQNNWLTQLESRLMQTI